MSPLTGYSPHRTRQHGLRPDQRAGLSAIFQWVIITILFNNKNFNDWNQQYIITVGCGREYVYIEYNINCHQHKHFNIGKIWKFTRIVPTIYQSVQQYIKIGYIIFKTKRYFLKWSKNVLNIFIFVFLIKSKWQFYVFRKRDNC